MAGDPGQSQPVCSDPTSDYCRCCARMPAPRGMGMRHRMQGLRRAGRMISRGQLDEQRGGPLRLGLLR
jgi:hypothetical protein